MRQKFSRNASPKIKAWKYSRMGTATQDRLPAATTHYHCFHAVQQQCVESNLSQPKNCTGSHLTSWIVQVTAQPVPHPLGLPSHAEAEKRNPFRSRSSLFLSLCFGDHNGLGDIKGVLWGNCIEITKGKHTHRVPECMQIKWGGIKQTINLEHLI